MSGENAECASCGVTAADLPYEDMGLTVAMASEFLFDHEGPVVRCNGCAESEGEA